MGASEYEKKAHLFFVIIRIENHVFDHFSMSVSKKNTCNMLKCVKIRAFQINSHKIDELEYQFKKRNMNKSIHAHALARPSAQITHDVIEIAAEKP